MDSNNLWICCFWVSEKQRFHYDNTKKMWVVLYFRDPNNKTDEFLSDMDWDPLESNGSNYLDIGAKFTMKNGLFAERYCFWDKLFPSKQRLSKNLETA